MKSCPGFTSAIQASIPFPRKELAPGGCIPLWEASDSFLFRKSITMLCTEELRVCFFRHSIFKQLQSCSLQQTVQPLAASMGQAQDEFSSVQVLQLPRRGTNSYCRCSPFPAMSHWDQPTVCSSGVMLPGEELHPTAWLLWDADW